MSGLPTEMDAIRIREFGDPDVLEVGRLPVPQPKSGEVLVKVHAAGLNRGDLVQRVGKYPPPPGAPDTPGLEVAGEIAGVGEGVTRWRIGDKVCGLVGGGGYAEYCIVDAGQTLPIPEGLSMVEAAGLVETAMTVWTNVFEACALQPGETLLVHGGASGIGTMAIEMATALGSEVYTTVGDDERRALCEKLGAVRTINYRTEDFVAVVKEATGGKGVDVILDMVGGDYVERNMAAAAFKGRIVWIAFLGGSKVTADLRPLMGKRLTLTGSTLRGRTAAEKNAVAAAVERTVWPLVAAGRIRPVIDSTFPLAEAAASHRRMEQGGHTGKIVLEVIR